ncbi:MAG: YicC family protein [Muribaculaceae bacterium]|nr:YicC family protein [Muribaculaceae bacterium]
MILSMTGFGRGSASSPNKKITVEIKSLNSKQLDLALRVPSVFRELEVETRNLLAAGLERGKVELSVNVENLRPEAPATVNVDVLAVYKKQIEEMADTLGIDRPADWYSVLLRLPDALRTEVAQIAPEDLEAYLEAVRVAADALVASRRREGERLYGFFCEKIDNIGKLLAQVEPYEKERVPKIRQRLEESLERLSSIEYDRGRLEQDLIFYIEKLDVSEEKLRLTTHLGYFLETLGAPDAIPACGQGKKLGFIAQEMGREINTLGSKSNHAEMQKIVVKMKDELEQIKEQVLNVL